MTNPSVEPLFREGAESISRAHAKEAMQQFRTALRESKRLGDQKKAGWALVQMAMIVRGQRQYPSALGLLEEARTYFGLVKHNLGLAVVFNELAFVYRELQQNHLALECAEQAVRLFQELGQTVELGWAYDNLAVIHMNLFHRPESLAYAKRARAIFMEHEIRNGLGWNACNLGFLYLEMGFVAQAEKIFSEALNIFTKMNNANGMGWARFGFIFVHRALCRFDAAMQEVRLAKNIFKELDMKDRVGLCLLSEAAIKRAMGQTEEAMLLNKRALQLFEPLKNLDGMGWCLFQVGQIMRDRGQLVKSWQTLREAITLQTEIGNKKGIGWAENDWGETYVELGDLAHARECFVKAKVIADQLDDAPLKVEIAKNIAGLHLDEGFLQKAAAELDEAETLCEKNQTHEAHAEIHLVRARYYLMIREPARALESLDAAEKIISGKNISRLKPRHSLALSEAYCAEGKINDALVALEDVLVTSERFSLRHEHVLALLGLVQILIGKRSEAQIMSMLAQIEKEVRLLGSRSLRAKLMAVKGLVALKTQNTFEGRFFSQAVQIAQSAGLVALEKKMLDVAAISANKTESIADRDIYERNLSELFKRAPADIHLVLPADTGVDTLRVSLVS